mmetsp:Transcript_19059/g.37405  ORF Transcript_19059/g.37405 Transcript_19059/m.37405 type:complete len:510 (+) Transcript_19059:277-1806(+)|eukprot:CAMPEP_0171493078 /NCGR_PEP_ID=MMETSP0958-20121227/4768_1 /TAXON_ID=87120 /ORGANISM="Aurantiochytrium limacinum, Strain ATCCMYA-1381" /LENGTH=509 /DNA_ID=CAMNT_0012026673 /DNA_START=595 /DNA_END=2124 /DNA_ORIENTATION=-
MGAPKGGLGMRSHAGMRRDGELTIFQTGPSSAAAGSASQRNVTSSTSSSSSLSSSLTSPARRPVFVGAACSESPVLSRSLNDCEIARNASGGRGSSDKDANFIAMRAEEKRIMAQRLLPQRSQESLFSGDETDTDEESGHLSLGIRDERRPYHHSDHLESYNGSCIDQSHSRRRSSSSTSSIGSASSREDYQEGQTLLQMEEHGMASSATSGTSTGTDDLHSDEAEHSSISESKEKVDSEDAEENGYASKECEKSDCDDIAKATIKCLCHTGSLCDECAPPKLQQRNSSTDNGTDASGSKGTTHNSSLPSQAQATLLSSNSNVGPLTSPSQRNPENEAHDVELIATALWALASAQGAERGQGVMAQLDCSRVPGMELGTYLKRVLRSINLNDAEASSDNDLRDRFTIGFRLLGCALVLMDRLVARTSHREAPLVVSQLNVHRLLLCSMMIVSKFSEDEPLNNAFWASAGGMPLPELNECELMLVKLLDFDSRVADEDFVNLLRRLRISV